MMLERQLKILMTDEKSFKEFKEKISTFYNLNLLDDLKRNRASKVARRNSAMSPQKSPSNQAESFIEKNCNLVPHFKEYEAEKRKLISDLNNQ